MKNIHLASLIAEPGSDGAPSSGRLRAVTNSPQREYAARAGDVERLPDSVAALILCKVGRARVIRGQIKIEVDTVEMVFTSRDSIIIAAKDGTDEKVLWALNRRAPDVLHLLTNDGAYIESLPRKGEATWFSNDEASKAALATAKAHLNRDMERLRELHGTDTEVAARAATENAAYVRDVLKGQTERLVQSFPAASDADARTAGGFVRAEQFVEVEARIDRCREERAEFERGPIADAEDFADATAARRPTEDDDEEAEAIASAADFC